jgi:hypothetical protein
MTEPRRVAKLVTRLCFQLRRFYTTKTQSGRPVLISGAHEMKDKSSGNDHPNEISSLRLYADRDKGRSSVNIGSELFAPGELCPVTASLRSNDETIGILQENAKHFRTL